jgi:hypothetical protein
MLSGWTKTFRVKATIVLAALYALCILAPALAFAFSDNPAVAHCLTEGHVGIHDHGSKHDQARLHVHAGSTHQHHDHDGTAQPSGDDSKGAMATCCGLFSVLAISGELFPTFEDYSLASVVWPVLGEALSGRGPERINRPPIV